MCDEFERDTRTRHRKTVRSIMCNVKLINLVMKHGAKKMMDRR